MNNHVRFFARLTTSLAFILIISGMAGAKEIEKNFHEKYDVQKGAKLILSHGDGDVTIRPWDRDEVEIKVRYHSTTTNVGIGGVVDFDVEFRQEGRDIVVRGKEISKGVVVIRTRRDHEYTYTIRAPAWLILQLKGDDGNVAVKGWRERIDCTLDDGDVELRDVEASSVELRLEDGDVEIEDLRAALDVRLDDGDLILKRSTMSSCSVELEDGDLEMYDCAGDFDISIDDGEIELRRVMAGKMKIDGEDGHVAVSLIPTDDLRVDISTDDGSVLVELDREISAEFAIRTDDGHVRIDLSDVSDLEKEEHFVSGTIGKGKGTIRIRTADGGVVLREEA